MTKVIQISLISFAIVLLSSSVRAQDFSRLMDHPEAICEYDYIGYLHTIDYEGIRYYLIDDNIRLANTDDVQRISFLNAAFTLLSNVQPQNIPLEMLEEYYFPFAVEMTKAFYGVSKLFQSLAGGRTPQFERMKSEFASANGWEKYRLFMRQVELLMVMGTFPGNLNVLNVSQIPQQGMGYIGGNLHYIEYSLFGSDRVMSRRDPWPVKTIKKLCKGKYSDYMEESYYGNTVYNSVMSALETGDQSLVQNNLDDVLYLSLFLPANRGGLEERAIISLLGGTYSEDAILSWKRAYKRRYKITDSDAESLMAMNQLSTMGFDNDNAIDKSFIQLRDSLYFAGAEFAELYPCENYNQFKDDSLFNVYRSALFEQICNDAYKCFANIQNNDTNRQIVASYLITKYENPDIYFIIHMMLQETFTFVLEENPMSYSVLGLLANGVELFRYSGGDLPALLGYLLCSNINAASSLYNGQLSTYYRLLMENKDEDPHIMEEFLITNSLLASIFSRYQYLLGTNTDLLNDMISWTVDSIWSLDNTTARDNCRIASASALYDLFRTEDAANLLKQVENPADEANKPYLLSNKLQILHNDYTKYHELQEDAYWLLDNESTNLDYITVSYILGIAIECEDELLSSKCVDWIRDHKDSYIYFLWLDSITRDISYLDFKQRMEVALFNCGMGNLFCFNADCRSDFADFLYNYALGVKGLLLKSDHLILNHLINSEDTSVSDLFSSDKVVGEQSGNIANSIISANKQQLISELVRRNADSFSMSIASDKDVRESLGDKDVAVEYLYLDNNGLTVYALIQRKDNPHTILVPIDVYSFTQKYGSLANPDFYEDKVLMSRLYECIWGPLKDYLQPGDTVYYSMDGELNFINSEVLPASGNTPMGAIYNMRRVSSTGVLPNDIYLADCSSARFYGGIPVKGEDDITVSTKREVTNLSRLLKKKGKNVEVFKGRNATVGSLLGMGGSDCDIIHVATHGYFDEGTNSISKMQRFGMIMYDGKISAEAISKIDLSNVKIIILSACESGSGEIGNDGVFGLQRGFKQAGAGAIIMALWPIETETTEKMMESIYEFFSSGMSLRDAFTNAQNKMRAVSNYSDWAAFVMLD